MYLSLHQKLLVDSEKLQVLYKHLHLHSSSAKLTMCSHAKNVLNLTQMKHILCPTELFQSLIIINVLKQKYANAVKLVYNPTQNINFSMST
jgi:hypothetical protein